MNEIAPQTRSRWHPIRLKFLGRFKGGAGFPHEDQGNSAGEIPFFKVKALSSPDTDGEIRSTEDYVSSETARRLGAFVFPKGAVVFAKVGAALLLNRFFSLGQASCIDNNMMGYVVDNRRADVAFLLRALSRFDFARLVNPGPVPSLNESQISNERVLIPPLAEQRRIAGYLDEATGKIDRLLGRRRRQMELLQEQRAALIQQAVTRGLNPNAPLKPSGLQWLGDVPANWEVMQLRRLIKPRTSITYGIVQAGPHIEGGIPYIRTSDMSGDTLPLDGYLCTSLEIDRSYQRSKVRAGDVVVAIRATIGKPLPVPPELDGANLTQGTAKISPGPRVTTEFLLVALRCESARQQFGSLAKGTTFLEITLDMLRRFTIPLPPIHEQRAIVAFIEHETAKLDTLHRAYARQLELLSEYRAALIHECVTGQRVVPDSVGKRSNYVD